MQLMRNFIQVTLLIAYLVHPSGAQNPSIGGPVLGFVVNGAGAGISPIFGVVGASVVGPSLDIGADIRNAIISPEQNYALAIRNEDAKIVIIDIAESPVNTRVLSEARAGADRIAISPRGTAAAVYDSGSGILQTIRGLPETPELVYEFNLSLISGAANRLAVSDDGTVALVNFDDLDRSAAWVAAADGSLKRLTPGPLSSMAFLPGRHDAILSDDVAQEVFLITDVEGAATPVPLISLNQPAGSPIEAALSKDGGLAIVITSQSQEIAIVDMQAFTRTDIACPCSPSRLRRLKGNGLFNLSDSDGPLYLLEASAPEPRIVVIPPTPVTGLGSESPEAQ